MSEPSAAEDVSITRRAGVVAVGTLGSRVLGALRDAVIAASFTLAGTDAFFVAWTIPNTLRQVLGEGAVTAAFIPVFSRIDEQEGRAAAERYYARFAGSLTVLLLAASALGVVAAPLWTSLYAAGYLRDQSKFQLTAELTALVFPYLLFAGIAALQAGALNALGRFFVPAFSPALLNVAMIAAPWVFAPLALQLELPGVAALALAALAGGLLQVLVQYPSVRAAGLREPPRVAFRDPNVRESLARMAPLIFGTGIYQINILLSRLLASLLPAGSQSFLYYGQRLIEIPLGMLTLAVASAALPSLSRLSQRGEHEQAKAALRHSVRLSLFVAIPASAALFALAEPTVTVLFGRGEFGTYQVEQTARSLAFMAAGIWAVAAAQGVTRMFYAYGDTRTPVLCSAVNLACFLALSLWGMKSLGHAAIALANSGAACAQLTLLLVLLRRRIGPLGLREVAAAAVRAAAASAVMVFVASDLAALGDWKRGGNDPRNLGVYALCAGLGLAVYVAASYLFGSRELQQLAASLRRKVRPA
jgi:putative peptidoglycan lipid II flippase